jgi:Arc/MetJ-type ribon-helix-helix transcriptional regulator
VKTGAYSTADEVLNAALTSVEMASALGFQGDLDELESLLAEGLASPQLSESEFWNSSDRQTDALLSAAKSGRRV